MYELSEDQLFLMSDYLELNQEPDMLQSWGLFYLVLFIEQNLKKQTLCMTTT